MDTPIPRERCQIPSQLLKEAIQLIQEEDRSEQAAWAAPYLRGVWGNEAQGWEWYSGFWPIQGRSKFYGA